MSLGPFPFVQDPIIPPPPLPRTTTPPERRGEGGQPSLIKSATPEAQPQHAPRHTPHCALAVPLCAVEGSQGPGTIYFWPPPPNPTLTLVYIRTYLGRWCIIMSPIIMLPAPLAPARASKCGGMPEEGEGGVATKKRGVEAPLTPGGSSKSLTAPSGTSSLETGRGGPREAHRRMNRGQDRTASHQLLALISSASKCACLDLGLAWLLQLTCVLCVCVWKEEKRAANENEGQRGE